MKTNERSWWWLGAVTAMAGCFGDPEPLPPPLGGSESTGGETTTDVGTADVGTTTEASSSTGPVAVCGNGVVEELEACDGTQFGGATCESLGQAPGTLSCTADCTADVASCVPEGMVEVPDDGTFVMGSDHPTFNDEHPIRQVRVESFWIDKTEVTVAAYAACEGCIAPGVGPMCNWTMAGREDHPVNCVTWDQASAYCAWAGKRLPTEAEWEKAARGTDALEYPWGDAPPTCDYAVMNEEGVMGQDGCGEGVPTLPVGTMSPLGDSPYEAQDMAGNVWEWVADWYAPYDEETEIENPTGPETGRFRILRGVNP